MSTKSSAFPSLRRICGLFAIAAAFALLHAPIPASAYTTQDSPFGINAHGCKEDDAVRMEELGVKWARCDCGWGDFVEIEGKGLFQWDWTDGIVERLTNHGINVLCILGSTPTWAVANPEQYESPTSAPPDDMNDYKDYVRAVVERYDGDGMDDMAGSLTVAAFELWNEPDLQGFWEGTPEQYADALIHGYEGAKEADLDSTVVMAGLSRGGKDGDFTDRMLDFIVSATDTLPMDVMCNHSYEEPAKQPDRIQRHRNSFISRGFYNVPYWYTEGSQNAENEGQELGQAAAVIKNYALYLANGVDKFFWYMLQHSSKDYGEGFFYPGYIKKQSWYAYNNLASLVSPRYFDSSLTILTHELEQYGFSDPTGATGTLYVLWSADDQPHDLELSFPAPALELISATGTVRRIVPTEGSVYSVSVDETPFYLREVDLDLDGPPVRSPVANAAISDNRPRVKWDAFAGASSYILQLSQDPGFPDGSTLEFNSIYGPNYLLQDPLAEGQWNARAIAVRPDQSQAYGPTVPFTVDTTPPAAPVVTGVNPAGTYLGGSILVGFDENQDPDAVKFNIYRNESLEKLADFPHSTIKANTTNFTDKLGDTISDRLYYYQATSLDAAEPPNESAPSDLYLVFFKIPSRVAAGWNLMSFPGDPPELSGYSPAVNYLQGVTPADGGGIEAYKGDAENIDPLKPYWILNQNYGEVLAEISGPIRAPAESVEFNLTAGWNLIPNPYPAPLPWTDDGGRVAFRLPGGTTKKPLSLVSANGWIRGEVFYYRLETYQIVPNNQGLSIPPFRSFWVQAYQDATLIIYRP